MNGVEKMAKDLAEAKETMDAMLIKIGEQAKDVAFLAERSQGAGSLVLGADRDCGASSNSIVAIAYGLIPLEEQVFPSDESDLNSCRRMLDKLPIHRITKDVHEAMFRANQYVALKRRMTEDRWPLTDDGRERKRDGQPLCQMTVGTESAVTTC